MRLSKTTAAAAVTTTIAMISSRPMLMITSSAFAFSSSANHRVVPSCWRRNSASFQNILNLYDASRSRSRRRSIQNQHIIYKSQCTQYNNNVNNNELQCRMSTSSFYSSSNSENDNNNDNDNDNDKKGKKSDKSPYDDFILNRSPLAEDRPIIHNTLLWLKSAVIGFNLCPFAERPYLNKQLFVEVIYGTNQTEIMARVLSECLVRQRSVGTTLIVCPDLFPNNFRSYLEVYNMIQDGLLVDHELSEDLQIAPFHPKFEFDGSGLGGIDNLTNQSPYPMFHILREEDVAHAVDILDGDASKVWKQNIQFLEELDSEFDRNQIENLLFTGAAAAARGGGGRVHHHRQQQNDDEDTNYDDARKKAKDILKRIKRQNNKR